MADECGHSNLAGVLKVLSDVTNITSKGGQGSKVAAISTDEGREAVGKLEHGGDAKGKGCHGNVLCVTVYKLVLQSSALTISGSVSINENSFYKGQVKLLASVSFIMLVKSAYTGFLYNAAHINVCDVRNIFYLQCVLYS